jgi:hypothetical protein
MWRGFVRNNLIDDKGNQQFQSLAVHDSLHLSEKEKQEE